MQCLIGCSMKHVFFHGYKMTFSSRNKVLIGILQAIYSVLKEKFTLGKENASLSLVLSLHPFLLWSAVLVCEKFEIEVKIIKGKVEGVFAVIGTGMVCWKLWVTSRAENSN